MSETPHHLWPDALDVTAIAVFLALIVLVPLAGYVFMLLDVRAYLRSLRRGLVYVGSFVHPTPQWARSETPRAIAAFGLRFPCTEADLKRAYRRRVKQLHPDHGGDERRFLIVQAQFEAALALVTAHAAAASEAAA